MEAPLAMVGGRDSAHRVHPSLIASSPPAGAHHHCWSDAGLASSSQQEQMHYHVPVSYAPQLPPGTTAQPKAISAGPRSGHQSSQEMPRNESVDSAISMTSAQGYGVKQVGLYTMHEKIGTGMYGAVRRATHKITKSEVAIKIVKKEALRPYKNAMMRIYREIEVQKRLSHPFVLDLLQVMETESTIYLVTELCQGGELFNLIQKRRRLSEPEARKYFCQLLTAVRYCHERGVVHRDIKAENLLLDEFGNVKLADFGFSNFFSDDTLLGTYCGSPQYAAPEVFLGKKYYGPQLDIWSLGVILHVFLTGSTPFEGRNFAQIQERVLNTSIEYPFYVSHEAAQLMNMMMNRDASQRATLRQVMNHRWLKHHDVPRMVKNSVSIYDYIVDFIPKDFTKECLIELGITDKQFKESLNRFDNVDGMSRLLVKEYRSRRLRKVWADADTINIVIAAQVLQSEGWKKVVFVSRIDADPVQSELAVREATIAQDEDKRVMWRSFLPGPEEYPYAEFKEEEEKEWEEMARQNAKKDNYSAQSSQEILNVDDSRPQGSRTTEIPDFEEAQQPAQVTKILDSVDSSEGYGGEMSALSTVSSSNSIAPPPDLKRMPSDVCSRMGALAISQKRRSIADGPELAPLPKRPSLPECLSQHGMEIAPRGALKLAAPPKQKCDRKTFFEVMRMKRKKAHGDRHDNPSARPNWFLPAPPLPEGGSFDDADDGKNSVDC